jgi:UDP-glucose 4-epimerase
VEHAHKIRAWITTKSIKIITFAGSIQVLESMSNIVPLGPTEYYTEVYYFTCTFLAKENSSQKLITTSSILKVPIFLL